MIRLECRGFLGEQRVRAQRFQYCPIRLFLWRIAVPGDYQRGQLVRDEPGYRIQFPGARVGRSVRLLTFVYRRCRGHPLQAGCRGRLHRLDRHRSRRFRIFGHYGLIRKQLRILRQKRWQRRRGESEKHGCHLHGTRIHCHVERFVRFLYRISRSCRIGYRGLVRADERIRKGFFRGSRRDRFYRFAFARSFVLREFLTLLADPQRLEGRFLEFESRYRIVLRRPGRLRGVIPFHRLVFGFLRHRQQPVRRYLCRRYRLYMTVFRKNRVWKGPVRHRAESDQFGHPDLIAGPAEPIGHVRRIYRFRSDRFRFGQSRSATDDEFRDR